jgi:hypothetical protein
MGRKLLWEESWRAALSRAAVVAPKLNFKVLIADAAKHRFTVVRGVSPRA